MVREKLQGKENIDFGTEAAKMLPQIWQEFIRRQHANIFSKVTLSLQQILVLDFLADRGTCKMNELSKNLNLTMSAATAIIDKMTGLRLVKREHSNKDRRVVNVVMLNKGKQMCLKVREGRLECLNKLFYILDEKDKKDYLRILKKMYANLKQEK